MRDNKFWNLYKQEQNKITYKSTTGNYCEFKTGSMKIPQLVSRIWTAKIIGELPTIKISNKQLDEVFDQDIMKRIDLAVNQLVAIGRTIVIPYQKKDESLDFYLINEFENEVEFVCQDGELVYLEYSLNETVIYNGEAKETQVMYKHYIDNGIYTQERYFINDNNIKVYLDGLDGSVKLANDFMFPFFVDLTVNFDKQGYPIWSNAFYQIKDSDKSYTEMLMAMERLRPVVGIPSDLVNSDGRNQELSSIDGLSGMFTLIPGMTDDLEWKYFGGTFDPSPYTQAIDFSLNNISQQCGLGHRALSYDRSTGVVKTATEVTFTNNESMINQSLINQTVEILLKRLIKSYYYMLNSVWLTDNDIEVAFEDAVFNSKTEYLEQLKYDVVNGNITVDYYLSEVYKGVDINKIKGSNEGISAPL